MSDSSPCFLFASHQRELVATGLGPAITAPAIGSESMHSALHAALAEGMQRARRAGQANPVIVGAIPFCTEQPSCLYIPAQYQWREKTMSPMPVSLPALISRKEQPDAASFHHALARALSALDAGTLSKVVLSAMQELHFAGEVDVGAIFHHLRAQNRNGYQFRVPLASGGEWIGASPELLLRKQGDHLVSNPLAGSARRMPEPQADRFNADQLMLSAKDQHEHALVIQEITAKLAPICAQLHVPTQPSLLHTETLWHLSTRMEGRLRASSMNALQIACLLHPTPAVCGFPTESARQLIAAIEPFDRGFFSGMVGWCDGQGDGEWAVALRCGQVQHQQVRLFAGAGIVKQSRPDAEWGEIQTKFGTMLRACGIEG